MAGRTINYHGGEKIYNKEKVDELLATKQDTLVIDTELSASSENAVQNKVIKEAIDTEAGKRALQDGKLDAKIGNLNNLETTNKSSTVAAINELHDALLPIDTAMDDTSVHAVQNKVIKQYVDGKVDALEDKHDADMQLEADTRHHADDVLDAKIGDLDDLETTDKSSTVAAINELVETKLGDADIDAVPTKDSEKVPQSGGTFDAIRFASVKVGETMLWPQFTTESRVVKSGNTPEGSGRFKFKIAGKSYDVTVPEETLELQIADNVPDGWHALDGKAELLADDYPELAEFFGGSNVTTDGKIWLPYIPCKIIKVRY